MFPFQKTLYLEDPDVQAMLALKGGDVRAFDSIMDRQYQRIYQFCYRLLQADSQLAQDACQEVFIKLYQMAPRYEPRAKVSTLLFQMARNHCLNERRTLRPLSLDQAIEGKDGDIVRDVPDVTALQIDDQLIDEEKASAVRKALDQLPEAQRTAVILHRYEQLSYEDIATTMKTTPMAVKSLLNRAKENLVMLLRKYLK